MNTLTATPLLESLASAVRLEIFRLLVRHGQDGMVAGAIASELDIPPTNLSFHLKALTQASLLTVTAEGRFQRYRANLEVMRELLDFLSAECCHGQPEQCGLPACTPPAARTSV